jgi:hypothetical protein
MYDLQGVEGRLMHYGEDRQIRRWIVETVARLPQEACEFACDRCVFLSIGRTVQGLTLPAHIATHVREKRTRNMWFVLLDERLPDDDAHSIIAHEVAHALLRHDFVDADVPLEAYAEAEASVAEKVKEWGFTGQGAEASPME